MLIFCLKYFSGFPLYLQIQKVESPLQGLTWSTTYVQQDHGLLPEPNVGPTNFPSVAFLTQGFGSGLAFYQEWFTLHLYVENI